MHQSWIPILNSCGWEYHDFKIPVFSKTNGERLYFISRPDNSTGIIPHGFNLSLNEQKELDHYFRKYSDNIYIGDLGDTWKLPDYRTLTLEYQVIPYPRKKWDKEIRHDIRQAKKYGVTIEEFDREGFWKCIIDTHVRQNRYGGSRYIYDRMCDHFQGIVAKYNGITIAGYMYVVEDGLFRPVTSASLTEYMKLRPNHLIYEKIFELADNLEIWLGNAPKELEGLKKFKESFGAEMRSFNVKYVEN